MEHIFLRCEEKFSRSQMKKPEQNTRFSALKYFFQISFRCWGVRKTPGFVICAKKGKNKWSSDETYIFSADRHLCLFHWRARFRNLGTRKMINQSGKSLPCCMTLHTVKFELTNQHSVGGKNCGVLTSRRFCALRFDFCMISEVYTVEVRFYFTVFFKFTACLTSVY